MRVIQSTSTVIFLGKRGENHAAQVQFPVAQKWAELYGDGTFQLIYQRNGDSTPYAVALSVSGENVCWTVTNTDVDKIGMGKCELQYYLTDDEGNNVLAKSMTFLTKVEDGLDNAGETPPEPWESWVTQVLAAGSEAQQAAEEARGYADEAEQWKDLAQDATDEAETYAANAYTEYIRSKNEADRSATQAGLAQSSAEEAERHVEAAEHAVDMANMAAGEAQESADEANESAITAENAAEQIKNMTVDAVQLAPDEEAYVEKSGGTGMNPVHLTFGLPQGEKGEKGDTGDCNFAYFEIDPETGELTATYTIDDSGLRFKLNAINYHLEVEIA